MSGVEVVGLVLAILPLVISGLEHYATGVRTLGSILNGPREFTKLKRRVEMEQKTLKNTIALLLQGWLPDQTISAVISGSSTVWCVHDIDIILQEKLDQESYQLFLDTVESMLQSMVNFKRRLQLDDNGRGPFNEKDAFSFTEAFRRFKFGLKLKHYQDLLNEIKNDNDRLASLVQQSSVQQSVTSTSKSPNFEETRKYATSVFETLLHGFTHKSCSAKHFASLRLSMSPGQGPRHFDRRAESYPQQTQGFRMLLHHDSTQTTAAPIWSLVETEIRLLESKVAQIQPSTNLQPGTFTAVMTRRVRFDATAQSVAPTSTTATSNVSSSSGPTEIQDLCLAIPKLSKAKCGHCLGYLKHGVEKHGLYWPEKQLFSRTPISATSLTDLLQQGPNNTRISLASCFDLAADLTQSLLWLHDTPWLSENLCRNRITFFKSNDQTHTSLPFIHTLLQQDSTTQTITESSTLAVSNPLIKNQELFALAILLIELALRQTFTELICPQDLSPDGSRHSLTDFCAAMRLLGRVSEEAGARYEQATRRCAEYALDPSIKLQDEKSREKIYKTISGVLEGEARRFHTTGNDLDLVV